MPPERQDIDFHFNFKEHFCKVKKHVQRRLGVKQKMIDEGAYSSRGEDILLNVENTKILIPGSHITDKHSDCYLLNRKRDQHLLYFMRGARKKMLSLRNLT